MRAVNVSEAGAPRTI